MIAAERILHHPVARYPACQKCVPFHCAGATGRHRNGVLTNVLTFSNDLSVYLSGDTEDIPEMRGLKDIDVAFVCMNLPYTMDVNQAASAVLEFRPKVVYPYHYRGRPDMSDTQEFKNLVDKGGQDIEVRLRNWYPEYQ